MTVADDATIVVSDALDAAARAVLGLEHPLRVRGFADGHLAHLPWHRERVFESYREFESLLLRQEEPIKINRLHTTMVLVGGRLTGSVWYFVDTNSSLTIKASGVSPRVMARSGDRR